MSSPVSRREEGGYIVYELGEIGWAPGEFDPGIISLYLEDIRDELSKDIDVTPGDEVAEEISKYLEPGKYGCNIKGKYTYVEPLEPFTYYPMPSEESALENVGDMVLAAYDASYHTPGGHFTIPVMIINIGYQYTIFKDGHVYRSPGEPYHLTYLVIPRDLDDKPRELISKEVEHHFVRRFVKYLLDIMKSEGLDLSVVMFDENFNLGYASTYSASVRKEYVGMYDELFRDVKEMGGGRVLPVGVYYSGRSSIIKCLKTAGLISPDVPEYRDRVIMGRLLSRNSRSSRFQVVSDPIEGVYRVSTVYMHVEPMDIPTLNVFMVEYTDHFDWDPHSLERMFNAVYLDARRGGGYPYLLSEAHHAAVIYSRQRSDLESILSELLLGQPPEYSMTGKSIGKRWRIL